MTEQRWRSFTATVIPCRLCRRYCAGCVFVRQNAIHDRLQALATYRPKRRAGAS